MPKPPPTHPTDFADTVPMIPPGHESGYVETVPLPLPLANVRPASPPMAVAPAEITLDDLLHEARRHNRVCPQPTRWLEFYRLIEQLAGGARLPVPPLTGAAWAATPAIAKRMCFREQLEWAAANNCIHAAYQFLKGLKEGEWHYMG